MSRLVRRVTVLSTAFLAAALPTVVATGSAGADVPAQGLLFGVSVSTPSGQTAGQAFATEEARFGRAFATNRSYSRWDAAQPSTIVSDDIAHGRLPLLSITPQRADGSKVSWASIAAGNEDPRIRAQADGLRGLAAPVVLIFHHEADISSGYGTAADFVAAYRHYVSVVRGENATGVSFGVVFVPRTFAAPDAWYPGDDVVDWIGTDAYNFAACAPGLPAWRSLSDVASTFYTWGSARNKPLMLAEWGSAEDPSQPGRKASWLQQAATTLAGWPQIKATAYFDRTGSCDWRLSTSDTAAAAFADLAHSPPANGEPTARLVPSSALGPAPLTDTFDLSTSTGAGSTTGSGVQSWRLDFGDGSTPATGTGQPTSVGHTYAAGHWTATLQVSDTAGNTTHTTAPVTAAPAPTVSEGTPTGVTTSSATVPGWIDTDGLSGSYRVEWGLSTTYSSRTADIALAALDWTQAVTQQLTGLGAGHRYHWRIVASSAAGTTYGPDRFFDTPTS